MRMTPRSRRGSAMIEFALVTPLLLLLLSGVLDYSNALRTAISVSDAARTGAQYGSLSSVNSLDTTGMQNAARNSAPNVTGMTATAVRSCKCPDGTSVVCTGTCATGSMRVYVSVTTHATVLNWFQYTGLPYTGAVTGKAVMRVR